MSRMHKKNIVEPENNDLYWFYMPPGLPIPTAWRWMENIKKMENRRDPEDKEFKTHFPPEWLTPTKKEIFIDKLLKEVVIPNLI